MALGSGSPPVQVMAGGAACATASDDLNEGPAAGGSRAGGDSTKPMLVSNFAIVGRVLRTVHFM